MIVSVVMIILLTFIIGVVYNVSHFATYHPGGRAQLMRGVGEDCTELFDKVSTNLDVYGMIRFHS